jgi:uncharacterized protein YqeY
MSVPPGVPPATETGGGDVRGRLRPALLAAMKARDTVAVSALRSVLAAIANAEAVPPAASPSDGSSPAVTGDQYVAGSTAGLAATEAERRELTGEEVAGIVRAEAAERRAAGRQYHAAGQAEQAERLLREARVIEELFLRPYDGPTRMARWCRFASFDGYATFRRHIAALGGGQWRSIVRGMTTLP